MRLLNNNAYQILMLPAVLLLFFFTACDDSSTGPGNEEEGSQIESYTVEDIPATDAITYYSLRENSMVEESDSASAEWDVAFSTTTIYTNSGSSGPGNGGAIVLDQAFGSTTVAPSTGYGIDTTATNPAIPIGSGNGWYNYNRTTHIVTPIENTTLIIKTGDGDHYAKLRVLSYYKGNPDLSGDEFSNNPDEYPSGHYTFEYTIQLNGSREFVE